MRKLSGNHASWAATVAREIREAGKPVSLDFLCRVVPSQFATSRNDGHVTAAENGLSRDDYVAGQRIWVEETVVALRKAHLVDGADDALSWIAAKDGSWKVKLGRSSYTVYGQAEGLASRDRHMLGDNGNPGYLLKGWSEVEVMVETGIAGKIKKGRNTLQVHPLAFAIPPMTASEQEQVRADIAEHGVRMPLTLYPDTTDKTTRHTPKLKVLDGRHRLQFASALGKSVRVEVFDGSEQEAREFVWSMNVARRHLATTAQRNLAAAITFEQQARAEAKKAQIDGAKEGKKVRGISPEPNGSNSEGKTWPERAAEMAGGKEAGVTADGIKHMAEVAKAPETVEAVKAGKVKTVASAHRAARAERKLPPTTTPVRTWSTTVRAELGRMRSHGEAVLQELDLPIGMTTPHELADLINEIEQIVAQVRVALSERGVL